MSRTLCCFLLCAISLSAQDLSRIDTAIGLTRHQQITSTTGLIEIGESYRRLEKVFGNMLHAPTFEGGASIEHKAFLLDDSVVNAYSTGGGRIYVTQGLMQVVGNCDGILAFVMGHEMIHNRNQHAARRYLRATTYDYEYRRLFIRSGALAANLYKTAALIAERKIERDEEHEADQAGLRIAAEAGYHPDYAILAARTLREETGESSKFAAFFSSHPRWTTREERSEKNYESAVAVFESRWPSVGDSPGGQPPAIASLTPVKIEKTRGAIVVKTATRIRNLLGEPAILTIRMFGERDRKPVDLERRVYVADQLTLEPVRVSIAKTAFKGKKGKYYVIAEVASERNILVASKPVRLK